MKQSSVKCWEHNDRFGLNCVGILMKMNCSHFFLNSSSFGSPNKGSFRSQRMKQRLLDMVSQCLGTTWVLLGPVLTSLCSGAGREKREGDGAMQMSNIVMSPLYGITIDCIKGITQRTINEAFGGVLCMMWFL